MLAMLNRPAISELLPNGGQWTPRIPQKFLKDHKRFQEVILHFNIAVMASEFLQAWVRTKDFGE